MVIKLMYVMNLCTLLYFFFIILVTLFIHRKCFKIKVEKLFFSLCSKINEDYFNCETLLLFFDTYVSSILNYGCEVWGYHKADDVEKAHINYVELGRFPMHIERYCRMLKYWLKLLCTDNCILKCLYEDMFLKVQ